MFENFEKELHNALGGDNLSYIRIFYDFKWNEVIGHSHLAFKNGKSLTNRIKKDCPEGKKPALILTTNHDAQEMLIENEKYYAFVVNIEHYLQGAKYDFSAIYLAASVVSQIKLYKDLATNHCIFNTVTLH